MKSSLVTITLAVFVVGASACKKEPPAAESTATEVPSTTEASKVSAEPVAAAEPGAAAAAETPKAAEPAEKDPAMDLPKISPAQAKKNCVALYATTKKMFATLGARFGKQKKLPSKKIFNAACLDLPPQAVRCMNPTALEEGEREQCQKIIDSVDKKSMEAFTSIMR